MKGKVSAYFTVEAALVFPLVLGVVFLVMYLMFFQYGRCLSEQDMGALALYGATVQAEDGEERVRLMSGRARGIYEEKYVMWKASEIGMKLERNKVKVERSGSVRFPLFGLAFWNGGDVWETTARYENPVLDPVSLIRKWRKLSGGE